MKVKNKRRGEGDWKEGGGRERGRGKILMRLLGGKQYSEEGTKKRGFIRNRS